MRTVLTFPENSTRKRLEREYTILMDSSRKDRSNTELRKKANAVREKIQPLYEQMRKLQLQHILSNKNSYLSVYLFETYVYNFLLDSTKKI